MKLDLIKYIERERETYEHEKVSIRKWHGETYIQLQ